MEHLVREQGGEPMIALISRLHSAHADQAASKWSGEAKAKLLRLADLAHKAIDMDTAGYIMARDDPVFADVPAPRYCFHSSAATPSVFVGHLPSGLDDEGLRRAFAGRYDTTKMAHVIDPRDGGYGFVYFGSESDMKDALKLGEITVRGQVCIINLDDSKNRKREAKDVARPPSESVVGKLWEVIQKWRDTDLAGLDAPTTMEEDIDLEAEWLTDSAMEAKVRTEFGE